MTANSPQMQTVKANDPVIRWLLEGDPAIRWQTLRDLAGASAGEVANERARVASEGMGARLLALQGADGRWAAAAWNRGWNSTMHALMLLHDMGLDPASSAATRALGLVRARVTWKGCGPAECDDNPFFAGELEPCINGQVGAAGAYFGQDVSRIIDRLLKEQLPDGGWNCEAENGATRSSFNTTICVLEALLEHELQFGPSPQVSAARLRGEEYLLERRLFHRKSTAGGAIWGLGMTFSLVAATTHFVGPAVSYAIGQGATMVSAAWGVFVWREFARAPGSARQLLTLMFVLFLVGLGLVAVAPLYA